MNKIIKNNLFVILNTIAIIVFLFLPYVLFDGNLRIGGDDSRLFYLYPEMWLDNVSNSSWTSFSSVATFGNQFFFNPLLVLLSFIKQIGISQYVIQNSIFSSLFIGGMIFFQLSFKQIFCKLDKFELSVFAGSIFYVLSPILLISPLRASLAPMWLIPLAPCLIYLCSRYIKSGRTIFLLTSFILSLILALAFNAIPWVIGLLLPMLIGLLCYLILSFRHKFNFTNIILKRFIIFIVVICLSQAFWAVSFVGSVLSPEASVGSRIFNTDFSSTFFREVQATAKNNTVLYPLLNLFHIGIQQDFKWPSLSVYENWHKYIIISSCVFIILSSAGLFLLNKKTVLFCNKLYLSLWVSFLCSTFLFTVTINPAFLSFFVKLGEIPGFVMFRNFYDKFAFGFVFLYAYLLTSSLVIMTNNLSKRDKFAINILLIFSILINAVPLFQGKIINDHLREIEGIGLNINIPDEYVDFMEDVSNNASNTKNILSVPFNVASNTLIQDDENVSSYYIGKSPVKLFSGINDYSGSLSFDPSVARLIENDISSRNYENLKKVLSLFNVGYIFETNNIVDTLLDSRLFNQYVLSGQDDKFKDAIYGEEIVSSSNGNYALYGLKENEGNDIFSIVDKLYYYNINQNPLFDFSIMSGLMDQKNVVVLDAELESISDYSIKSVGEMGTIPNGTTNFYTPYSNMYVVNFVLKDGELRLVPILEWLFSNSSIGRRIKISSNSIIVVEGNSYRAGEINDLLINGQSEIEVYEMLSESLQKPEFVISPNEPKTKEPTENSYDKIDVSKKVAGAKEVIIPEFDDWNTGDCGAIDERRATYFFLDKYSARLEADHGHNACIYISVPINSNFNYKLSFDLYTNAILNPGVYVAFDNSMSIIRQNIVRESQGGLYSMTIEPPHNSSSMSLYLYSGRTVDGLGKAITEYENLSIAKINKAQENLFIVEPKKNSVPYQPSNISIRKHSEDSYSLKIENANNRYLLINHNTSFHSGWKMVFPGEINIADYFWAKQIPASHFFANGLTNLWVLDLDSVCELKDVCAYENGNRSINVNIIFSPRKLYYIGLSITLIAFIVLCVIGLYPYLIKLLKNN